MKKYDDLPSSYSIHGIPAPALDPEWRLASAITDISSISREGDGNLSPSSSEGELILFIRSPTSREPQNISRRNTVSLSYCGH